MMSDELTAQQRCVLGPVYTYDAERRDGMCIDQIDRSRRLIDVATTRGVALLGVKV